MAYEGMYMCTLFTYYIIRTAYIHLFGSDGALWALHVLRIICLFPILSLMGSFSHNVHNHYTCKRLYLCLITISPYYHVQVFTCVGGSIMVHIKAL